MAVGGARVRPDIVFTRRRVAVFVDGCFWHGCPAHGETPASNREFWEAKIAGTRERDRRQTAALEAAGWMVVRVWEHETMGDALARIIAAVDSRMTMNQGSNGRRAPKLAGNDLLSGRDS